MVAGRLEEAGGEATFVYGRSYLERREAISLYAPELPLIDQRIRPLPDLDAPAASSMPAQMRGVSVLIMNRLIGSSVRAPNFVVLSPQPDAARLSFENINRN